ncbi:DNA-3-methyladenine glycosylase [Paraburkholderia sp. DHOC27]|uniref:DNA-3-methyladenine glycosylase family protein n=1 Tax=Paraburkholderia sp. DHOC27 TaxID=2303330 RepID=UPI000E3D14B2|nr:DNA-3-methyladenine glycosylase [Paraburkholderia sp. DHOC27]RFU45549.1 DNA-3-methyladenine glycosylase 2 family protein [Paraburkholderia sp. DHOC27]
MATATKAPAKRAASKTSAAAAVKSTRARSGSTAKASSDGAGKTGAAAGKSTVKRALNGAGAHAPASKKVTRLAKAVRPARGKLHDDTRSNGSTAGSTAGVSVKAAREVKGAKTAKAAHGAVNGTNVAIGINGSNGALPVALKDDVQELARDTLHEGEVVRKSRVLVDDTNVAVPVQVGGLTPEVTRPAYWDKACADLVKRDRILKKLIPKFGPVHLMSRGDPFVTLARSVVGQQVSVASAQAAWERVENACPKLVPQQFMKLGQDKLMACGLSRRKAEYILDLAGHFVSGALHVGKWTSMDDEAVIAELTQIRGIGRWTAEMFLIFNLSRPDVLPLDDLGLIRAISVNYFSGEPVTRSEAREVAANWEPWRTVATWYMWRSLDPLPVDY